MSTTVEQEPGYAKVILTPEQAKIVARSVWFRFGCDLEPAAHDIDMSVAPSHSALEGLDAMLTKYRGALDLLEWGAPADQVEFVATRDDLDYITGSLMESGSDRVGAPTDYVGAAEGFTEVEQVRDQGLAEIATAKTILEQLKVSR